MTPKRVLVVEDDAVTRSGLAAFLRDEGYVVDEAPDGLVAWSLVRTVPPDLVLTDLGMPLVGGQELIRQIRSLYPSIPIAILSVEDPIDAGRRCVSLNASQFFHKPVKLEDVLRFVLYALRHVGDAETAGVGPHPASLRVP